MLSQHDRRALADIENHLRDSDPEFVRRLDHPAEFEPTHRAHGNAVRTLILIGLIVGLSLVATAFATRSADAIVWAFVVLMTTMSGTAMWAANRLRHQRREHERTTRPRRQKDHS